MGRHDGFHFFDDFQNAGAAQSTTSFTWRGGSPPMAYEGFGTSGVTMNAFNGVAGADKEIGVLQLDVDADDEEAYLTLDNVYACPVGRISDTAGDNHKLWFEARVRFDSVASGAAALAKLVGLGQTGMAATGTIGADGAALGALEFVGFRALAADGDGMDAVHYDAAEIVVVEAAVNDALVITADAWKKFGIYFDGTDVWWYINGVRVNATGVKPSATNFPDAEPLVPVIGGRQHGTGDFEIHIDWWRFAVDRC